MIRDTYTRFQTLIHEIGKFGLVGIVSTIITFGLQNVLYGRVGPLTGVVIANGVATCFAFLGNRYWAFRHRKTTHIARETVLFVIFNVAGTLIQAAFVGFNHYILHNHDQLTLNIANVLGVGTATLFRLFCYRKFVFNEVPPAAPPAAPVAEELVEPATIP
ncbi:MAG TPA: GtrA family protein [Trebonia sp.]|nr:GtrA family protein [Trebonia sp.]